jgi:hypothetical protein
MRRREEVDSRSGARVAGVVAGTGFVGDVGVVRDVGVVGGAAAMVVVGAAVELVVVATWGAVAGAGVRPQAVTTRSSVVASRAVRLVVRMRPWWAAPVTVLSLPGNRCVTAAAP